MPPESQLRLPYNNQYLEEDEINLLDILIVFLKHKWLILGIVLLAGLASVYYSFRVPNIYRSEATILPREEDKDPVSPAFALFRDMGGIAGELAGLGVGGSLDKFELVLKSRHLSHRIVEKHKLMPRLFKKDWDPEKNSWISNPPPTAQDAYQRIIAMITFSRGRKSEALIIKFDHEDPHFAKEMVNYYLTELSEVLREETLKDAEENQRFLRRQLEQTPDALMREKIYAMLAREIEKETFARAQRYYSFIVVDPPIVSDLDKRVKPKRRQIFILSVLIGFFGAVILSFFIEYLHNLGTREDPERYKRFKNSLKMKVPSWW